jgi:solute carrier family 25 protein 39/40
MPAPELTLAQRSSAAMGAAMISAIVVTPLDVAKTLQQVSDGGKSLSLWGAIRRIARREGVAKLWRGTGLSMATAVPAVGVYLVVYDKTHAALKQTPHYGASAGFASIAPLLSGVAARTVAVCLSAPLELARTRVQAPMSTTAVGNAAQGSGGRRVGAAAAAAAVESRGGGAASALRAVGLRSFSKGIGTLLARDVPFSAVYWMLVEHSRPRFTSAALRMRGGGSVGGGVGGVGGVGVGVGGGGDSGLDVLSGGELVAVNLAAGVFSGSCAALLTTPMDVVYVNYAVQKTAGPTGSRPLEPHEVMRRILKEEGAGAMFKGVVPRIAKVAPACAIVVSSYEALKRVLS